MRLFDTWNGGKEIEISCKTPLEADTVINVKSPDGKIVGRLNVMKNSNYKDYELNIHIIAAYVTNNGVNFNKTVIDTALQEIGGLTRLENYLNKQSLNQALIQVKFHLQNNEPYNWPFSKNSLESANRGENPQNNQPDVYYKQFTRMITDTNNLVFKSAEIVNFFNHQFKRASPDIANKKSIFLYLTSLESDDAGGTAFLVPLNNKHCIIFKPKLKELSTYAHEIAHTLGIPHTFPETGSYDQEITNAQANITNLTNYLNTNRVYFERHQNDNREKYAQEKLVFWQNTKIAYEIIKSYDLYKYEQSKTDNFLDYNNKREAFYVWQIKIMQNEVNKYYH